MDVFYTINILANLNIPLSPTIKNSRNDHNNYCNCCSLH